MTTQPDQTTSTHVTRGMLATDTDKLSEIGWFDLDDLPQPLSVFTQTVLTYLR